MQEGEKEREENEVEKSRRRQGREGERITIGSTRIRKNRKRKG